MFLLCMLLLATPGDTELDQLKASLQADAAGGAAVAPAAAPPAIVPTGPRGGLQSMNPDIAAILDVAAATYNTSNPMELGDHDAGSPGFTLQQLELYMGANVDPYFRVDTNIVFTAHGVELEEAYATSLGLPGNFQLRAGQYLNRFGRINSTHPHQWHFIDQPLVLGKFYGSDGDRNIGAELSWLSPLPWFVEVVLSGTNSNGRSYRDEAPAAINTFSDVLFTGAIKQFFVLHQDMSLLWGLSGQTANNDQGGRTIIYGTDIYLRYRPLESDVRQSVSLQAEVMGRHRTAADGIVNKDVGGYAEVVWAINPSWETGARAEYVSGLADDPIDEEWTAGRSRYALQAAYYPTHFSRVRVQAIAGHPQWLEDWIYGAMVSLEVVAGAHGAHVY